MKPVDAVTALADAVLYEGYLLYPYRPSAVKNRFRWNFGVLYPPAYAEARGEASACRTEVLVQGGGEATIRLRARFLRAAADGKVVQDEAALSPTTLAALAEGPARLAVEAGAAVGELVVAAALVRPALYRLSARLANLSSWAGEDRDEALSHSLLSAQLLLESEGGLFVSQTEPPEELRPEVERCRNVGCWPVLVGPPGSRGAMLAAPIILPDHPRVAPKSPGDLFDGTEIDEILTLRVRTLSDEEKREVAGFDERGRALLERSEALTRAELARLHAEMEPAGAGPWAPGRRVRLRPKRRADIIDAALEGRLARVESVETDFENRTFVTVSLEDDPGRDLGGQGFPGHRFFFELDEVEAA